MTTDIPLLSVNNFDENLVDASYERACGLREEADDVLQGFTLLPSATKKKYIHGRILYENAARMFMACKSYHDAGETYVRAAELTELSSKSRHGQEDFAAACHYACAGRAYKRVPAPSDAIACYEIALSMVGFLGEKGAITAAQIKEEIAQVLLLPSYTPKQNAGGADLLLNVPSTDGVRQALKVYNDAATFYNKAEMLKSQKMKQPYVSSPDAQRCWLLLGQLAMDAGLRLHDQEHKSYNQEDSSVNHVIVSIEDDKPENGLVENSATKTKTVTSSSWFLTQAIDAYEQIALLIDADQDSLRSILRQHLHLQTKDKMVMQTILEYTCFKQDMSFPANLRAITCRIALHLSVLCSCVEKFTFAKQSDLTPQILAYELKEPDFVHRYQSTSVWSVLVEIISGIDELTRAHNDSYLLQFRKGGLKILEDAVQNILHRLKRNLHDLSYLLKGKVFRNLINNHIILCLIAIRKLYVNELATQGIKVVVIDDDEDEDDDEYKSSDNEISSDEK